MSWIKNVVRNAFWAITLSSCATTDEAQESFVKREANRAGGTTLSYNTASLPDGFRLDFEKVAADLGVKLPANYSDDYKIGTATFPFFEGGMSRTVPLTPRICRAINDLVLNSKNFTPEQKELAADALMRKADTTSAEEEFRKTNASLFSGRGRGGQLLQDMNRGDR